MAACFGIKVEHRHISGKKEKCANKKAKNIRKKQNFISYVFLQVCSLLQVNKNSLLCLFLNVTVETEDLTRA